MEINILLLWFKYNYVFKICVIIMFVKGYFINKVFIMENIFYICVFLFSFFLIYWNIKIIIYIYMKRVRKNILRLYMVNGI